jgi:hypothetical protein
VGVHPRGEGSRLIEGRVRIGKVPAEHAITTALSRMQPWSLRSADLTFSTQWHGIATSEFRSRTSMDVLAA